tara:strand:- start:354 stop:617 length:264 start_codon:yes stop_codon:yes gene_type:complete
MQGLTISNKEKPRARRRTTVDKLNEMLIGTLAILGGFITKRIFTNHDALADRISALEKIVVTKDDLNSLERNVEMIVTHLITSKGDK